MTEAETTPVDLAVDKPRGRFHWARQLAVVCITVALIAGVITVIWQADSREDAMVNVIRATLSWPAVTLALGLFFGLRFQPGLTALLRSLENRAWKGKIGSAELAAEAVGQPPGTSVPPPTAPDEDAGPDEDARSDVGDTTPLERVEEAESTDQLAKAQSQTWFWYLEYLAQFLRPHTQAILAFFAVVPVPIMVTALDSLILPSHPTERWNVMTTLFANGLLQKHGDEIFVTEQGRRFLEHQRTMGRAIAPNANPFPGLPPEPIVPWTRDLGHLGEGLSS